MGHQTTERQVAITYNERVFERIADTDRKGVFFSTALVKIVAIYTKEDVISRATAVDNITDVIDLVEDELSAEWDHLDVPDVDNPLDLLDAFLFGGSDGEDE